MTLFPNKFRWLHRLIRKNTTPIPEEKASLWKQRLSIAYMIVGWHIFGFACYVVYTGKGDIDKYYGLKTEEEINKPASVYYAELLGVKKAHIYKIKHFTKVAEFDYEAKEEEEQKNE